MAVVDTVKKILAKRVDVSNLKEDDDLSALGLDSLDLVEVMIDIEEELGVEFTSDEIINLTNGELVGDIEYYKTSGGGVTLSGGDPLCQPEFTAALCHSLDDIHKAIQTSGFAPCETYREVISGFDYVMQDIKIADPQLHKKYTGVSNENILKNIELKEIL